MLLRWPWARCMHQAYRQAEERLMQGAWSRCTRCGERIIRRRGRLWTIEEWKRERE